MKVTEQIRGYLYLEEHIGAILHAGPHLPAEAPERAKAKHSIDAMVDIRVMELLRHHFVHLFWHLHGRQDEHPSCKDINPNIFL